MTAQYPPASGDGQDASGVSAADLSYADVTSPPQPTDAYVPAEQVPAAPEHAGGVVRTYSWPTPPYPQPVESSEVDSVDALAAVSEMDTEPAVDDDPSTVDIDVTASEVEQEPSMVDEIESGASESVQEPESEPQAQAEEPEPTDPAVAQLRAVSGRLSELDDLPIEEHPARYEELHAELTGALAQIDRAPDSQA